jgi:hypothetical protein
MGTGGRTARRRGAIGAGGRPSGVSRHRPRDGAARLASHGPRRTDLTPPRRGVAILSGGDTPVADAHLVIDSLVAAWPDVVLACPGVPERPDRAGVVPVVLDRRGAPVVRGPRVVQTLTRRVRRRGGVSGPGVVEIPPPVRGVLDELLAGRLPGPSRWMRAWGTVWGMRWA